MKRLLSLSITCMLLVNFIVPSALAQEARAQLAEEAMSAILIERDTGTVLYEKNAHEKLPPASMTKIMTMLLMMEAIDDGRLNWDDKIRTSERAASMGGSQVFLEPGEEMTASDMLKAIAIASGNDASVAVAEHLAGSEEEFVRMMNEKAKELGLKNTQFSNSNGLPVDNHYSSAYDLAIMSKELLKYEEITKYTGIYEDYLRENTDKRFWLVNTNKLVRFYPGVDGIKTGFTREAKYCLAATAKKDGMRVIAVVMGSATSKERNRQVTEMLDYSFSQFMTHELHEKGEIVDEVRVSKGEKTRVPLELAETVSVLTKKGEQLENIIEKVSLNESVHAPIKKGDKLGILTVEKDGKVLSNTTLVAAENVDPASWWQLFKRTVGQIGNPEKN